MIFIDPVNKMQPRKELKYFLKHSSKQGQHVSQESLELSEEVDYSYEFTLTPKRARSLTAQMSINVLILQTTMEELTQKHFSVSSINELDHIANDWQLTIQPPPREKKPEVALYSEQHPEKSTDQIQYNLLVPILCQDNKTITFTVVIHCNRLFSETHLYKAQHTPQIKVKPTSVPYTYDFLSELSPSLHFILDSDGELDQLSALSLSDTDTDSFKRSIKTQNPSLLNGLRIWRLQHNRLRLHIMGDEQFGAVFVENIFPMKREHQDTSKNSLVYDETATHFDIEV